MTRNESQIGIRRWDPANPKVPIFRTQDSTEYRGITSGFDIVIPQFRLQKD